MEIGGEILCEFSTGIFKYLEILFFNPRNSSLISTFRVEMELISTDKSTFP